MGNISGSSSLSLLLLASKWVVSLFSGLVMHFLAIGVDLRPKTSQMKSDEVGHGHFQELLKPAR